MTPAGTSNELDVQNGWEENTDTHTFLRYIFSGSSYSAENKERYCIIRLAKSGTFPLFNKYLETFYLVICSALVCTLYYILDFVCGSRRIVSLVCTRRYFQHANSIPRIIVGVGKRGTY